MEINVKISCPDLALAAAAIAKALMGNAVKGELLSTVQEGPAPAAPVTPTAAPVTPLAGAASAPSPSPAAPVAAPAAAPAPVTAPPSNPAPVAPAAPVSPAPQITLDQIGKAGADLMNKNPAILPQLSALLQKYGVQTVQQIKPDQIGAFALELRGLGAAI